MGGRWIPATVLIDRCFSFAVGLMGPKARRESRREEEEKEEDNKKREAALEGASHEQQEEAASEARRTNSRRHEKEARRDSTNPTVAEQDENEDDDGFVDVEEPEEHHPTGRRASASQGRPRAKASSSKPSTIFIHSRPVGRRRESVRQQVFGGNQGGRQSRSGSVSDPNLLAPPSPSGVGRRGRPILNASREGSAVNSLRNTTSRDVSPASRSRGLRFAEGTAESSQTAPGPSFYKRPATHNPDLAITRTASVQSNGAGEDAASTGPLKGQTYYNNRPGSGSGLQMYKSRSIQSNGGGESEGEGGKGGFLSRLKRRSGQ